MKSAVLHRPRSGMTLVELLVVMSILTVAVAMFTSMVIHTSRQRGINRENAIAANAARVAVESMRNEDFRDVYALFNGDPSDDPGGAGTAPGARFAVPGLTPLPGWPDDLVGEVVLPVVVEEKELDKTTWGCVDVDAAVECYGDGSALGGVVGGGVGGLIGGGGGAAQHYFLREDYVDERMGMPRDLNGDSLIDAFDHSDDYTVLPVHVVIEWRGSFGPRRFDLYTQVSSFEKLEEGSL